MKIKSLVLSFSIGLGVLITISTYGQEENNLDDKKGIEHSVGIACGSTTGYGLAYKLKFNTIGFQTNFAPYIDQYKNIFNFGLTVTKDIITNTKTKFFLYLSNSYNYEDFHSSDSPFSIPRENIKYFNSGIGIGIEFIILEKIEFNIMAGYGVYRDSHTVNIAGETGLFYKF